MSSRDGSLWREKLPRSNDILPSIDWLRDSASLTTRLQARGTLTVRVLYQGLSMPTRDDAVVLGIKRHQLAWVREVALLVDGQALVFAHTVLPHRPRGPMTGWLARLGKRSLGALLFGRPGFSRGPINCKRLDRRHALFRPAIDAMHLPAPLPPVLWARRSYFTFGGQCILVTEVFSPLCAPLKGVQPIRQAAAANN